MVDDAGRIASLVAENSVLAAENAALRARVVEVETLVGVLLDKITVLEKLLKSDSSNSSRPPSSDAATAKNRRPIANSRKLNKGTKRSQGKQPGAPGGDVAGGGRC